MPTAKITDVQIWNQMGQDATLFDPNSDAISFAVGVELSADLTANLQTEYHVSFQIIQPATNEVVVNSSVIYKLPEDWHAWWFTAGDNWDNYTTAVGWGLVWTPSNVFGFRAILTTSRYMAPTGEETFDTLDVSQVRWFQVIPVAFL